MTIYGYNTWSYDGPAMANLPKVAPRHPSQPPRQLFGSLPVATSSSPSHHTSGPVACQSQPPDEPRQMHARCMSDTYQMHVRCMPDICQMYARYMSDACQMHVRCVPDGPQGQFLQCGPLHCSTTRLIKRCVYLRIRGRVGCQMGVRSRSNGVGGVNTFGLGLGLEEVFVFECLSRARVRVCLVY